MHAPLRCGRGDSDAGELGRSGGHAEGLRRRCGEAAGEKLGAAPVNRCVGNVGTLPGSPSLPCAQHGGGQAGLDEKRIDPSGLGSNNGVREGVTRKRQHRDRRAGRS